MTIKVWPIIVKDNWLTVDDEIGELSSDPHGSLFLPILFLSMRRRLGSFLDDLGPFDRILLCWSGNLRKQQF